MKRLKLIALGAALVAVGVLVPHVGAMGYMAGGDNQKVVIAKEQTVDSSAYLGGTTVLVDGTIKGDLYCAGNTIVVSGTVEGDVLCAGNDVSVVGTVKGDVRLAGNNVTIKGTVASNASLAASNARIATEGTVGGDVTGGANTLTIEGKVGRDMLAGGALINLSGVVGRDMSAGFGDVVISNTAKVNGNLHYYSDKQASIPSGVVAGKTEFTKYEEKNTSVNPISAALWLALGLMMLACFVTLVAPRLVHTASLQPARSVVLAFLTGFAGLILIPVLAGLFAALVVGLPIAVALLLAWLLMITLSSVFVAYYVGSLVLKKRGTNALYIAAVGALILAIALIIPVVNVIVLVATLCIGMGMQLMHLKYQFGKKPYTVKD